jgi:hypothetical protein
LGTLTSFVIAGLDLWFNSDDHLPPHFHAEKPGHWEVRVLFLRDEAEMLEVRWTTKKAKPGKRDLRELAARVESHRSSLL